MQYYNLRKPYPNELYHYGVEGMHWGQRRYQNYDGTLTEAGQKRYRVAKTDFATKHKAKKDAKEYARAKMFYGKGAGNRRKLIKNTVEQRSKDPRYKQAFDEALSKQDMSKHASAAKRERKRKDIHESTAKTARGVMHLSRGDMAKVGVGAIAVYSILHYTGADAKAAEFAKTKLSEAARGYNEQKFRNQFAKDWSNIKVV